MVCQAKNQRSTCGLPPFGLVSPDLAWSTYEAKVWSKSFDPSLSKSMISMRKLYVIVDQNMSFCRGRLELSSEKDSSIPINLLKCYDYFTNLNLKFLRYIFWEKLEKVLFSVISVCFLLADVDIKLVILIERYSSYILIMIALLQYYL